MLAKQRQDFILNELANKGSVVLTDLIEQLNSSSATIRRDLQFLETKHLLKRVHGGAVSVLQDIVESSLTDKVTLHPHAKRLVAEYVANNYIRNNTFIYLDAGTATHAIIPYLTGRQITVVTNGVHHIDALLKHGITTMVIGGHIKANTQAVVGALALEQLSHYGFDVCLLGTNSIDIALGCSTPDERESLLKRKARQQAKKTIILADATKFDKQSRYTFATLDDVIVVSDNAPLPYNTIERVVENDLYNNIQSSN